MWFRKYLVEIRGKWKTDAKKLYLQCLIGFLVTAAITLALDIWTPFESYWMIFRSLLLIPLAFFAFSAFYALAVDVGNRKLINDSEWVPYRARWSPKWRRNLSFIMGAFIIVLVYALEPFPGYTILSSFVVTSVIGMVAFCRMTRNESKRTDLGIPDPRDTHFEKRLEQQRKERANKRKEQYESDEEEKVVYADDDERVVQSHKDSLENSREMR